MRRAGGVARIVAEPPRPVVLAEAGGG